jgi:hypothetical protein
MDGREKPKNKTVDREPKGPFSKPRSSGGLPIVTRDNVLEKRSKGKTHYPNDDYSMSSSRPHTDTAKGGY